MIELVTAVVILAIVSAVALPVFSSLRNSSTDSSYAAQLANLAKSAQGIAITNNRTTPTSADFASALAEMPTLAAASAGIDAAASVTLSTSSSASVVASTATTVVSVDTTSTPGTSGLARQTPDGGCAMAQLTSNKPYSWFYTSALGSNCSGTTAIAGPNQATPTFATTPASGPTWITPTVAAGQISLSWTAPTITCGAITGYVVYQAASSSGPWTTPAAVQPSGTSTNVTVTGLTNGTTYYFEALASTSCGNSPLNSYTSAVPAGTPTAMSVTATATGTLTVSWTAPSSTGGAATGYVLQQGTSASGPWSNATTQPVSTATSAVESSLGNNTTAYFQVAAKYSAYIGPYTSPAGSATTWTTPDAPTIGTPTWTDAAGQGYNVLTVNWTAPASNGGTAVTAYTVQWSNNGGSSWTTATTAASGTSYAINSLPNGTTAAITYTVRVAATNTVGTGSYSGTSSVNSFQSTFALSGLNAAGCTTLLLYSVDGSHAFNPNFFGTNAAVLNMTNSTFPWSRGGSGSYKLCVTSTGNVTINNSSSTVLWSAGNVWLYLSVSLFGSDGYNFNKDPYFVMQNGGNFELHATDSTVNLNGDATIWSTGTNGL